MNKQISSLYFRFFNKAGMATVFVAMMLQRTPIVRVLADLSFSMGPKATNLLRVIIGAGVTVGAVNTVTAATGDLTIDGDSTSPIGSVGDEIAIVLIPEAAGSRGNPQSYKIEGELPPGITFSFNRTVRRAFLDGFFTAAGDYSVTITPFQLLNEGGAQGQSVTIDFEVAAVGPDITTQPLSQAGDWGGNVDLSISVADLTGVTFQWQKEDPENPGSFEDIVGQTSADFTLSNLTSSAAGAYRVIASDATGNIVSDAVDIGVNATSYELYKETNFNDPFSLDAGEFVDIDLDGRTNLEEHHFGLNPNDSDTIEYPLVSREEINGQPYVVYSYPAKVSDLSLPIVVEENIGLATEGWATASGETIIENSQDGFLVKIPVLNSRFSRLKFQ